MTTDTITVSGSPAWAGTLMGCVLMMQKYSSFPYVQTSSGKNLIALFVKDFQPVTGPPFGPGTVKSMSPTDYVLTRKNAQIWCDIICDICLSISRSGMRDAAIHMMIPLLPLAKKCGYWDLPKNKKLGVPPIPDDIVDIAMKMLIGKPGETIDVGEANLAEMHGLFNPYPDFDEPKEDGNKPDEKEDNFFDFDGLGGRFGVN